MFSFLAGVKRIKMRIYVIIIFTILLGSALNSQPSYFTIDTTKIITKETSHQCLPQVFFDGENFIATWADGRRHHASSSRYGWYRVVNSIYASRISPQGRVLDTLGVCIDEEETDSIYYEVACATSGNNSLIAGMYTPSVDFYGTKAKRVGRDMVILDSVPISCPFAQHPKVTFGGGYYFLVFSIVDSQTFYYGQRITEEGVVVDSQPVRLIKILSQLASNFQLTSDSTNYLLVYSESEKILGIMINNEVQIIDTIVILRWSGTDQIPAFGLTFGGGYYFVSYAHNNYIYGVRVRPDGVVVDTVPILIDSLPYVSFSRCAYGDGIYLVVIEHFGNLYCKRVSIEGQVIDPNFIPINEIPSADDPSVAFGESNFIVVWQDYLLGDIDIRYTLITPEGIVLNPGGLILSTAAQTQEDPDIAFDGSNYLAVWTDYRNYYSTKTDILGALLSPEGIILDPGIFPVCGDSSSQTEPDICFGGEHYFVVWTDGRSGSRDIYGTRITPEGVILDTLGIPIHTVSVHECSPAVAFDGENYLVVCEELGGLDKIYGARVSLDGVLLDTTAFLISDTMLSLRTGHNVPVVRFNGENYLVAWRLNYQGHEEIWGAIVDPTGRVGNNFRISEDLHLPSQPPSITTNGNDFFTAWYTSSGVVGYRTLGVRVSNEGMVLDTPSISLGRGTRPSLAFDGSNYILLRKREYLDYKKLNLCFINQEGVPLDTNGIDILETPSPIRTNRIVKGPSDQCLAVFGTYASEPYNTQRIHGAFFNTSGIKEITHKQNLPCLFSVSPTIVKRFLTLKIKLSKEEAIHIKIYDASGRVVKRNQYNFGKLYSGSHKFQIDLSALPSGVYFILTEPKEKICKIVITR